MSKSKTSMSQSRRQFLQASSTIGGGFVLAFYLPGTIGRALAANDGQAAAAAPVAAPKPVYPPNAFVIIAPDSSITLQINKLEMGQGVNTSMAQLIAEELECDWTKIRSVSASVNPVFNHTQFGAIQMTGGSTALNSSWDQHLKIGATMREMLKQAAATRWGVKVSEVKATNGTVVHAKKGVLTYGELAEEANKLPMPENPPMKKIKDYKIIGKSLKRVDAPSKVNGTATFGIDVKLPGMLYAVVARPPLPGAKLKSIKESDAKKIRGVVDIVKFEDRVAVLAKNTYAAIKGREALDAQWDLKDLAKISDTGLMATFKDAATKSGKVAEKRGDAASALGKAKEKATYEYEFPLLAHASMEPLNCTITFDGKKAEAWAGFQMPTSDRAAIAKVLGLKPEDVIVNTTYAGGSFGRRASKNSDYAVEAAQLVKKVKKPLKVTFTREDDMRAGFYRPMTVHRVEVGLDDKKQLSGWKHHIAGLTVMGNSMFGDMMIKDGLESAVTEGVSETPYALKDFVCEQTVLPSPVTTLWWRSVGHTHTGYVMETMIDEVAEKMNKDPWTLRRELLAKHPRQVAVLDLLKKMSGYGKGKAPKGRAWGMAIHESFGTVVGQVAEVSLDSGTPVVHRVWAAAHCGHVVNPEQAKTQVEGGIVLGLSAALYQQIKIENGVIQTGNFDDYPVLRINQMPKVEVAFVKSDEKPTGLGEPGVPPIAPAVANALYRLTKQRLRKLPFPAEFKV